LRGIKKKLEKIYKSVKKRVDNLFKLRLYMTSGPEQIYFEISEKVKRFDCPRKTIGKVLLL